MSLLPEVCAVVFNLEAPASFLAQSEPAHTHLGVNPEYCLHCSIT